MTGHESLAKDARRRAVDCTEIVGQMKEGIAVLDGTAVVFANPAFPSLVKVSPEELAGREFPDLFPVAQRAAVRRACERALRDNAPSTLGEFAMGHDADEILVEMTLTALNAGPTPLVQATLVDVTSRHRHMEEIQKLNERLESILHSMHDVVISLSAEDDSILSINPAAELLFGIPLREFSGSTQSALFSLVHPDDRDKVRDFYRSLRDQEYNEMEYRIVRSDRKTRWVRDEGYVVYCKSRNLQRIDHMIRDITEQKQAIQDLHKSERKYKDFFHKTKDMAFRVSPEGFFLDINDAGVEMLGLPGRREALQSNVGTFTEDPSVMDDIMSELEDKGFISNKYVTLKSRSGHAVEVDITARAKKNEAGEILYYEGIASNITQALENQRNRVLRNTASGMCHYLNSHLMHISSALDGLDEELSDMDERFMQSADAEKKDEIWFTGREMLGGYVRDVRLAYRKISEITRAFNSAFLTYREESYLDKTILDIFGACRPKDGN